MMFFIGWIIAAALVSMLGDKSTLGKAGIFMVSLVFSPLIGLIVCMVTEKSKQQIAEELAAIKENTAPKKRYTSADEKINLLDKARSLLKDGVITEAQFNEMRDEIVSRKEHGTFNERCPLDPSEETEDVISEPMQGVAEAPSVSDNIFLRVLLGLIILAAFVIIALMAAVL